MMLDGWKKFLCTLTGVIGLVAMTLTGHLTGLEASIAITTIVVGHQGWQSMVDRVRTPPERQLKRKTVPLSPDQLEAIRAAMQEKSS
jgi:mRNA-degrading endonuclease toxin of MazEF toxin-antitoxin module